MSDLDLPRRRYMSDLDLPRRRYMSDLDLPRRSYMSDLDLPAGVTGPTWISRDGVTCPTWISPATPSPSTSTVLTRKKKPPVTWGRCTGGTRAGGRGGQGDLLARVEHKPRTPYE